MTYEYNGLLARLVGHRLQSVHFTGDYAQLGFTSDGSVDVPVLTFEAMPAVQIAAESLSDGRPGYTDALRALIGRDVTATHEAHGDGLAISFGETSVRLCPDAADPLGSVIATLSDFGDGSSMTWQPGGAAFEYLG